MIKICRVVTTHCWHLGLMSCLVGVLLACGGEDIDQTPTDPTDGGTPVQGSAKDIAAGAQAFQGQCVDCHDPKAASIVAGYTLSSLQNLIQTSMPLKTPAACEGECARTIAVYLADVNPGFGKKGTGDSQEGLGTFERPTRGIDSAPIVARRLNRFEYNNTIRDLFADNSQPADNFPVDDFGHSFNNTAAVLTLSPRHMEDYSSAAEAIALRAVSSSVFGSAASSNNLALGKSATASGAQAGNPASDAVDGDLVSRWSAQTFPQWLVVDLGRDYALGGTELAAYEDRAYQFTVEVADAITGPWAQVVDRRSNTAFAPIADAVNTSGRFVRLTVTGASGYNGTWTSIPEFRVFGVSGDASSKCDIQQGASCARSTAQDLGRRVWRRPLSEQEVELLVGVFNTAKTKGFGNQRAMAYMIQAMLSSPNFLFRVEVDPDRNTTQARNLSDYELASRLSYFIWSSTPDDLLLDAAEAGKLSSDTELRAQITRMLADPRSETLIEQFAVQWLKFDLVQDFEFEQAALPNFNKETIEFFRQETRAFLNHLLRNDRPLSELVDADYSFINGKLAGFYGVNGINSADSEYVRVNWNDSDGRSGILGHGSFLTSTSTVEETSPVARGVWVLENLICNVPPPPPPGVEANLASIENTGVTTREIFEQHRDESSVCFSCHKLMDPIGFGLENFDMVGRWRDMQGGKMVDTLGELPSGDTFNGPVELAGLLSQSEGLPMCATQHLLSYALGRDVRAIGDSTVTSEPLDYAQVYEIVQKTKARDHSLNSIISEIVLSPAFRKRRGADSQFNPNESSSDEVSP